jgi:Cu/Ag efflux pump CusA
VAEVVRSGNYESAGRLVEFGGTEYNVRGRGYIKSVKDLENIVVTATDRIIKEFAEVDRVLGKAGRAETSTDPAPLSMLETIIILKPKSEWRRAET